MEYIKKLIKAMKDIIVVLVLQYMSIIILGGIYLALGGNDLLSFYTNYAPYILCLIYIILIYILWKRYKIKDNKVNAFEYYKITLLGISLACYINMVYFAFGIINEVANVNKFILILSSSVLGPIVEELLFRKNLLDKLLKFNNKTISIILSSFIFAFMHSSINSMIYAFILGIVLGIIYLKYNNIKITIYAHMISNIVVIFLTGFNIYLLYISLMGIILSIFLLNKKENVIPTTN